jgi:hypothetical protein
MLLLDARREAPTTAITLTTKDPDTPAAIYREGSRQVWRALRDRFGRVEYAAMIEWTTGWHDPHGYRRMHGHHLGKGIPTDHVLEAESIVREVWSRVTGAIVVEVAALISPGAAIGYMGLHHRKPQQAPPSDWHGARIRWSQGYLYGKAADVRRDAKRWRQDKTAQWKVQQRAEALGWSPEEAALALELERARTELLRGGRWHLRSYHEDEGKPLVPSDFDPVPYSEEYDPWHRA